MERRDRWACLALLLAGLLAWLGVAVVLLTQDPGTSAGIRYTGAGLIGLATGLTAAPTFWLVAFALQRRISFRGDWLRAARRGAWVGGVVGLVVVLRVEGLFQPQIGLFVAALAIVAEVSLSARR